MGPCQDPHKFKLVQSDQFLGQACFFSYERTTARKYGCVLCKFKLYVDSVLALAWQCPAKFHTNGYIIFYWKCNSFLMFQYCQYCWFSKMHFIKKNCREFYFNNMLYQTYWITYTALHSGRAHQRFPKVNIDKMHWREMLLPKQIKS